MSIKKERINIGRVPAILWGDDSSKLYIAVHGNMSNKEDTVIEMLANRVISAGFQVLSFDLPTHGDRKDETTPCKIQNAVSDICDVIKYVKEKKKDKEKDEKTNDNKYESINIFACSMGACFSMIALDKENLKIDKTLFLSPVVNMKKLIENMMTWAGVTLSDLEREKEIKTNFDETLYLDYYNYVVENEVKKFNSDIKILYGSLDNMQDINDITEFCDRNNATLEILNDGEHFFHTKEQLEFFDAWLVKNI